MKLRVSSWLACAVITACGPITGSTDDGPAATGVGSSGASTSETGALSASEAGTPSTSEVGTASTTEPGDTSMGESTEACTSVCLADFPCNGSEPSCVDASTVEVFADVPCEEVCEDYCACLGSSCLLQGDEPCPEGTWCVETNLVGAACRPAEELCGGPDGLACAADELCEYVTGLCPECALDPEGCGSGSPVGTCVPRPTPDEACPELDREGEPFPPQCGCDGVLYASECERQTAGVPWADDDACR